MSVYMKLKYKTKFNDKEILKKAFKKAKVHYLEKDNELICDIEFYELHFIKSKTGEYEIQTRGYNDWKDDIKHFRDKVSEHYNQLAKEKVQKQICDNIKSQIKKNPSYKLEQEEVLEDNSVLLTISI